MRATAAARCSIIRRRGAGWRAVALALLCCFTLQSYVTQTHIHGAAYSAHGTLNAATLRTAPGQSPIDGDRATCPFCQAIIYGGAFDSPAAPLLLLPTLWTEVATPRVASAGVTGQALTHGWQSRAPPRH
jgi:Protein of unknown function (DUF2946)